MWRMMGKAKRINRATYWMVILLGMVLSLFLRHISIVFSVWGIVAMVKRCRDFGVPGWVPVVFGATLTVLGVSLVFGNVSALKDHPHDLAAVAPGFVAGIVAIMLIQLAGTVVIGVVRGNPEANAYGEPPLPGVGKGVRSEDYAAIFGDGPGIVAARPRVQVPAAAPARAPASAPADIGHPLRRTAGFGRKGL